MEKKQNKGGGLIFYLLIIVIIAVIIFAVRHNANKGKDYSYAQFVAELEMGIIESVTIIQNEETPTGRIIVYYLDENAEVGKTYVSDVNEVQQVFVALLVLALTV